MHVAALVLGRHLKPVTALAKVRRFHKLRYASDSWRRERLVIARVEATAMGSDARFVVTNLAGRGKVLYEKVYHQRAIPMPESLPQSLASYARRLVTV